MVRYYEDFDVGDVFNVGSYEVTEAEMVEFAEEYDPQPFHVDKEAAKSSFFGELVASGLFTLSVTTRASIDGFWSDVANLAGLGFDDLRWERPVYAGDELSFEIAVEDKRIESEARKGGELQLLRTTRNQDGDVVLRFTSYNIVERRGYNPD